MSDALARINPNPETMNVLAPQSSVDGRITPMHAIMWTLVKVDAANETYAITGGGLGMHKSAIGKIATAAGIRVTSSQPIDIPGMTGPECLVWQVKGEMDLGGELPVTAVGTKMWQKNVGKDGKDMEHFLSKTETKAMLRMVRALLGIQSKYNKADFDKPFAVPHIVYSPDYSDPNVREVLEARNAGNTAALYGSPAEALPPAGNDFDAASDEDDDGIIDGDYVIDDGRTINTATGEVVEPKPEVTTEICAADTTIQEATPEPAEEKGASAAERQAFGDLMGYTLKFTDQKGQTLRQVFDNKAEGMGMAWLKAASDFYATDHHKFQNPDTLTEFENIAEFYRIAIKAGL